MTLSERRSCLPAVCVLSLITRIDSASGGDVSTKNSYQKRVTQCFLNVLKITVTSTLNICCYAEILWFSCVATKTLKIPEI